MKIIPFLVITLLSNSAFTQKSPAFSFFDNPGILSSPNNLFYLEHPQDTSIFYSTTRQELDIHQVAGEPFDLVQYDSVYWWSWDTLTNDWRFQSKNIYTDYNADHQPISYTVLSWNGMEWVNEDRYFITYDEKNRRSGYIQQSWVVLVWENFSKAIYTYDNNDLITQLFQLWYNQDWEDGFRIVTEYDGNHNLTKRTTQSWSLEWLPRERYTYTYDSLKNLTSQLYEIGQGIDWVNNKQNFYSYDSINNLIRITVQVWNGVSWDNDYINFYTYDSNNNRVGILTQTWNAGSWVNDRKQTNTYNANKNITNALNQMWNGFDWDNSIRYNFTYDGNLQIKLLREAWSGSNWLRSSIQFNNYDENKFHIGYSIRDYDETGDIVVKGDSVHFYFQIFTGIEDLTPDVSNIILFPNPTNGLFTISSINSLGAIKIYDLSGKCVFTSDPVSDQTSIQVDLSGYSPGVYIININDGQKAISRKVVVQ